jgi:hypothetical protein
VAGEFADDTIMVHQAVGNARTVVMEPKCKNSLLARQFKTFAAGLIRSGRSGIDTGEEAAASIGMVSFATSK